MAVPQYVFAELVRESCTATGTGVLALGGALPGHRRFADAVPAGATFCYTVAGVTDPAQWECGVGQINAQGRLVRSAVSASSNGNAPVDFGAGLKTVALTVGAGWLSAVTQPPVIADVTGLQAAIDGKLALAATSTLGRSLVAAATSAEVRGLAGVGSMAVQEAGAVSISGGAINGTAIGSGVRASMACTTLSARQASSSYWNGSGFVGSPNAFVTVTNAAPGGYDAGLIGQMSDSGGAAQTSFVIGSVGTNAWTSGNPALQTCDLYLAVRTNAAGLAERLRINGAAGQVTPGADNAQSIGSATRRWTTLFATTGTINTSDARDKVWRGGISERERRAARAIVDELGFFQWAASVEAKGSEARLHCGARAQAVWAIMAGEGLIDPIGEDGRPGQTPYAFLCFDEWPDDMASGQAAGWRYGLRTDQLALFLIGALLPRRRGRTVPT